MTKPFMFEKPLGMRDTLPLLYETKQVIRNKMSEEIKQWGYQFIETPALEFYETIGETSAILDAQLFKLLDQQGHTLVLRPEMTTPIARVAASKLLKQQIPTRLAYSENVYRAQQIEGGKPVEFEQIGIECIGNGSISADAEIISLLVSVLKEAGLDGFKISIGHVGFLQELFTGILGNEERAAVLRKFLYEKNYVGYREHIKFLPLSSIDKQRLIQFISLQGGEETIENAMQLLENGRGKETLYELKELYMQLKEFGVEPYISFDLTLVSHMSYYTGTLFEVYAGQVGSLIGNGGRYDSLFQKFDWDTPATGFAIRMDRLTEALGELNAREPIECVLFSQEHRQEALAYARKRRTEGRRVAIQDINAVQNVDAFTATFSDVQFFIGKGGASRDE
ncbi:ATP phosphoribosyltransferase regulatory subunit [Peribacillus cavernae]|uniref:ATP phosphoribosyltransferase regulatory subunit n=1 Tax=Peribacillus cavernae TaxID=1674310 RepID=A0A3S0VSZ8_9BACI|nr:ATP phosphoribosyltransferase regulatory subunit [Peribacillus cavernae]MDQ0220021.1 ATP phosphoribosyltransferase regulatory subunit [Peribacillus cavernae]RUQ32082.1 ATP phosphoribosyltransferase regulatory subunit [Peribacillus cavernae]